MNHRQERIIRLLAAGKRDKQIAGELKVSEGAVRAAINRTVASLGARTRCEAVALYSGLRVSDDNGTD
jgi:DNA-binding NarL/FixJ family response regulator